MKYKTSHPHFIIIACMLVTLLGGCSKAPATSISGASPSGTGSPVSTVQTMPGAGVKVTPELDNKDLVEVLIPVKGDQILHSNFTS